MNILLILVCAIIIASGIYGYVKGLLKMVLSLATVIITLGIVYLVSPSISNVIMNHTDLSDNLSYKVESLLLTTEAQAMSSESSTIDALNIPDNIKEKLRANNTQEMYDKLHISTFNEYIGKYMSVIIINAITFIAAFIVAIIAIKIILVVFNVVEKLPIIKSVNNLGGCALGVFEGLIVVWVMCLFITMFAATNTGMELLSMIHSSKILSIIYNNNVLLQFILKLFL